MLRDNKIWIAQSFDGRNLFLEPKMANRHGLIAGATGTGKTITLKVLAESFSEMGVPVFLADVKGDLAGMCCPGEDSENMQKRIEKFGLAEAGFHYHRFPVTFWDIYGKKGIQLRTTVSEMGPLLLSRILNLNELQSSILTIAFRIADENGLILTDTKDLKALLQFIDENREELEAEYGKLSPVSISAILRAVVTLEIDGGDGFFGEPALDIRDWVGAALKSGEEAVEEESLGMIHILDSSSLINNGRLYSTFLLWFLSELFETMPEVGDPDKPKMVFFFDEAHLLFNGISDALLEKLTQVVRLIRSKGVGVYFITQNPRDIPDVVLAQLQNKIQHALHAYTPAEQKAVKAAAESFRINPAFSTFDAIQELGTGQAVVSFPDEKGVPSVVEQANILPPESKMGTIDEATRTAEIEASPLRGKYAESVDSFSAYEFLMRRGAEGAAENCENPEEEDPYGEEYGGEEGDETRDEYGNYTFAGSKYADKVKKPKGSEDDEDRKSAGRKSSSKPSGRRKQTAAEKAAKATGKSMAGSLGREVGKAAGSVLGKTGKRIGGNFGAALGRGLFSTLFSRN